MRSGPWLSRPHSLHGRRESASALVCFLPRRWMISKSNSGRHSSHLASWPSGSLQFRSYTREPWSIRKENFLPSGYGLNCLTNETTASSSCRVPQYCLSALLSTLLPQAISLSQPSPSTCDRITPIPTPLASVSRINGQLKSGYTSTEVVVSRWRSFSNAL